MCRRPSRRHSTSMKCTCFTPANQKGFTYMRSIALFLISSILTPATLAAGQTTCLLATQIKVTSPLLADSSTALTVISNSNGNCVAESIHIPLRPAAKQQTIARALASKKPTTVAVVESLLASLGWTEAGRSRVSATPAGLRRKNGCSTRSHIGGSINSSRTFLSAAQVDNAVLRF